MQNTYSAYDKCKCIQELIYVQQKSLQRIFTYLLHLCHSGCLNFSSLALLRMWSSVSNPHPLTGDLCECAVSWEVFTGTKAALWPTHKHIFQEQRDKRVLSTSETLFESQCSNDKKKERSENTREQSLYVWPTDAGEPKCKAELLVHFNLKGNNSQKYRRQMRETWNRQNPRSKRCKPVEHRGQSILNECELVHNRNEHNLAKTGSRGRI